MTDNTCTSTKIFDYASKVTLKIYVCPATNVGMAASPASISTYTHVKGVSVTKNEFKMY